MSASKFKFISPGVFVNEIDNSQVTKTPGAMGPVIIGRSKRGPAFRPVTVSSFSDFVDIFGEPQAGVGSQDAWREGEKTAPTYGSYAAQAWLKNSSPVTYVRLLGDEHSSHTTAGSAGWITKNGSNPQTVTATGGGAYGLFVFPSASWTGKTIEGGLAAVWYCAKGWVRLSGTLQYEPTRNTASLGAFVKAIGSGQTFKAQICSGSSNTISETMVFDFTPTSDRFIRKVFNTNPTLTNANVTDTSKMYWLGESFERHVVDSQKVNGVPASPTNYFGVILPLVLSSSATYQKCDNRMATARAKTGWFFSQDVNAITGSVLSAPVANTYKHSSMQKLFRFVSLDTGEEDQKSFKVSIQDIRYSQNTYDTYGTFTVAIRSIDDTDIAPKYIERFTNCSMNPNSDNYVAKKIGDMYTEWDTTEKRYRSYGNFANNSKYIRIEMNPDADAGSITPEILPFGVYGPLRMKTIKFASGTLPSSTIFARGMNHKGTVPNMSGTMKGLVYTKVGAGGLFSSTFTASFPQVYLRVSSSDGDLVSPKSAYFGVHTGKSRTAYGIYDPSTTDVVRILPAGFDNFTTSTNTEYSWVFSLDDITQTGSSGTNKSIAPNGYWLSGSRAAGKSITAVSSSYKAVLDAGFNKYTTVFAGGFDGLDILEPEPFNNTRALTVNATETNSSAYYSIKRAIDSVSDPEVVECDLMAMPGITNESLNDYMLRICEDRGDAMAVIDLPSSYVPRHDYGTADGGAATDKRYTVTQLLNDLRARSINTSYGCAYHPWVQIRDSINNATIWAPPSIAVIGTFASSQKKTAPWFAPAGFNRGGLTNGAAGIPVVSVRDKLTSKERDDLYEANVNPIASFPSEGIVIFGQKTLQVVKSALDRINVRRLLIFVKKGISRIAANVLFDPNIEITWNNFSNPADKFLAGVKASYGLEDYKIILDRSTTTPELVDRNIMYAKIFLKPTKAVEYIAIDFTITNSGASFED